MSNEKMNSKKRMLSAIKCEEVDYVPMIIDFHNPFARDDMQAQPHGQTLWRNERERLEAFKKWGWDTYLTVFPAVTPLQGVETSLEYEKDSEEEYIKQIWRTSAGNIQEKIRITEDWQEAYIRTENIPFGSDFRTARYIEFPFKEKADLAALEYLFPVENLKDTEAISQEYKEKKALADEFQVPLFIYLDSGMDWLTWLYPAEEAIMKLVDEPDTIDTLLSQINKAKRKRLEILLEMGVDGVYRRGWYESTDFWNPDIFRKYAMPELKLQVEMVHKAGGVYTYLMMTGIMPLLDDLSKIDFDCLVGVEPVLGNQDLAEIQKRLPGKSIWGGISGPEHLHMGTPEVIETAVEKSFRCLGKKGFILSPAVIFRRTWPWENLMALEKVWKKFR